jgi:Domain of unknown function (DUF4432)
VRHSLHGRVSTIPARFVGYGERWEGDRCVLWAEGEVRQASVFGEDLCLVRRIEADVGGDEIKLSDRVVNRGFYRTPHMLFYTVNVGHLLLDEGARSLAPISEVVWAAYAGDAYETQKVGYRTIPSPQANFREQVWQQETAAVPFGVVPIAIVNDRIGLRFEVETKKAQLPCLYQWQHFQLGAYVMGIEPSSHHVLGDNAARNRGEMIWLEHDEARSYDVVFRVLDGPARIAEAERRIQTIAQQPDEDYPKLSGRFVALPGR